jgi:hypothetical protein
MPASRLETLQVRPHARGGDARRTARAPVAVLSQPVAAATRQQRTRGGVQLLHAWQRLPATMPGIGTLQRPATCLELPDGWLGAT